MTLQRLDSKLTLDRHRHSHGYVAVVLEGEYEEVGDTGRFRAGPGDFVAHARFEAHRNQVAGRGAVILNLPLEVESALSDLIRSRSLCPASSAIADWPDVLALALRSGQVGSLSDWSRVNGLRPDVVSRGFARVYGVSAKRYAFEARARRAWTRLQQDFSISLSDLAAELGFADQAHMTRAIRDLTGAPPSTWRAKCVQDQRQKAVQR